MYRNITVIISTLLIGSCASTHNLDTDGYNSFGGGFSTKEISPGKFRILAKTNNATLPSIDTAREMWRKEATKACENRPYRESRVNEYHSGEIGYIQSVKSGLAICLEAEEESDKSASSSDKWHRIAQKGYSLTIKDISDWVVVTRTPTQLVMGRRGSETDETFSIQSTLLDLPTLNTNTELINYMRNMQAQDVDPSRFTIIIHEVIDYKTLGEMCARSHLLAEDNNAVKRSDKTGIMLLEESTLVCVHPDFNRIGISVAYSQRYYPEGNKSDFISDANTIINSVVFESFLK